MLQVLDTHVPVMQLCLGVLPPHVHHITLAVYFLQLFLELAVQHLFFLVQSLVVSLVALLVHLLLRALHLLPQSLIFTLGSAQFPF